MVSRRLLFLLFAVPVLLGIGGFFLNNEDNGSLSYTPRSEVYGPASGIKGAMEYYEAIRGNPSAETIEKARKAAEQLGKQKTSTLNLDWIQMGPNNQGGRTRAMIQADDGTLFAGGVSGGLWMSNTGGNNWDRVKALDQEMIVASIAQTGNGNIYVGTGSSHDGFNGNGGSGFMGRGLYRSTDGGQSFQLVQGTLPDTNSTGDIWSSIDELAPDPNNSDGLWVARNGGLAYYDESNNTFTSATTNGFPGGRCDHVAVSKSGNVVIGSTSGGSIALSTDGGQNFSLINGTGDLPSQVAIGRAEMAISPDNENYIYVSASKNGGRLRGVYMSKDKGSTWHQIAGEGAGGFSPFYNGLTSQGNYDQVISVRPKKPGQIVLGGVTLWKWENHPTQFNPYAGQWEQVATNNGYPATIPFYVHSDVHEFLWTNKDVLFVGCDGGIFRSNDGLETFLPFNRNYITTQFYSMDFGPDDQVLGGTQDNGTQYINHEGETWAAGERVRGGDGFDCEISHLNPDIMFATVYNGDIQRSETEGDGFGSFLPGNTFDDFYTNIGLFEDRLDTNSQDSVFYKNTTNSTINPGDSITFTSRTLQIDVTRPYQGSVSLSPQDSTKVQDPVQSIFAYTGLQGGQITIYITRDALRLASSNPTIWPVGQINSPVNCYEFSADGNYLWIGLRNGNVYRLDSLDYTYNLNQTRTIKQIFNGPNICTGIAVDPNDPDHVVCSFGGYNGNDKIMRSTNATSSTASFSSIWDASTNLSTALQGIPVYDVEIHRDNSNYIIAGTEHGVFTSDDAGNTWQIQNSQRLGNVPVFAVDHQRRGWDEGAKNPGVIYIGTHGRGFFKSDNLLSVKPTEETKEGSEFVSNLNLFPNPVDQQGKISFELNQHNNVNIRIFDLGGKLVKEMNQGTMKTGAHTIRFDASELSEGSYFVEVNAGERRKVGKLVVAR